MGTRREEIFSYAVITPRTPMLTLLADEVASLSDRIDEIVSHRNENCFTRGMTFVSKPLLGRLVDYAHTQKASLIN